MTSIREAMARAIYAKAGPQARPWEGLPQTVHDYWIGLAEAALLAETNHMLSTPGADSGEPHASEPTGPHSGELREASARPGGEPSPRPGVEPPSPIVDELLQHLAEAMAPALPNPCCTEGPCPYDYNDALTLARAATPVVADRIRNAVGAERLLAAVRNENLTILVEDLVDEWEQSCPSGEHALCKGGQLRALLDKVSHG